VRKTLAASARHSFLPTAGSRNRSNEEKDGLLLTSLDIVVHLGVDAEARKFWLS
jgi:hypothetical protein